MSSRAWRTEVANANARGGPDAEERVWLRKVRVLYAALILANVLFAGLRGLDEIAGSRPTGYWINVIGAPASALLVWWFEGAPRRRFRVTAHLAFVLIWWMLVGPTWYGFSSSPWWLILIPLGASVVMRRWETGVWAGIALVGMMVGLTVVPDASPYAAAGEPLKEGIASRAALVLLVTGLGLGIRRAIEKGADELRATQRELEDALERMRSANEAKDVFLANVSHEIRTPLGGVIGMSELALQEALPSEARDQVRTVHECGRAALAIVNDILDISKIDSGRLSVEAVPVDLELVLRGVLQPLLSMAEVKGLALVCDVSPSVARHRIGDGTRLGQIVNNLVSNAIKFTAQGVIRVAVESAPGAPDVLTIAVGDSGIGIPADKLDGIFEKFVQVDASTTRIYGGTGLGLPIARELARLLGGDITVQSVLGAGATFTARVQLPVVPTGGEPIAVQLRLKRRGSRTSLAAVQGPNPSALLGTVSRIGRHTPVASERLAAGERARVLVAEDNLVNQRVLGQMLGRLGYDVTLAGDGLKAFDHFGAGPFDLIISDVQMPGIDGLELIRRVRATEAGTGRHTPVLILSAHAMQADGQRFRDAGADGYLSKPVRLEELAAALGELALESEAE